MREIAKNICTNEVVNPSHQQAMANLDLISKVIATHKAVGSCSFLEEEDFAQWGYEALYDAANSYKTNGKASFRTYATRALYNRFLDKVKQYEKTVSRTDFDSELYIDAFEEGCAPQDLSEGQSPSPTASRREVEASLEFESTNQAKMWVNSLIQDSNLSEREKTILYNKYDVYLLEEPLDTLQLAEKYHMTTQSVNRICKNALEKLRNVPA